MTALRKVPSHTIKLFRVGVSLQQQMTKATWPLMLRFEITLQRYPGGPPTFRLAVGRWLFKVWVITA
jgi:hypothetical protein